MEPTIIYANSDYWYPNDFILDIVPNNNYIITYKTFDNFIEHYCTNNNKYKEQTVSLTV